MQAVKKMKKRKSHPKPQSSRRKWKPETWYVSPSGWILVKHPGERAIQNTPDIAILKRERNATPYKEWKTTPKTCSFIFAWERVGGEGLETYTIIFPAFWHTPSLEYSDDNWD